MARLKMWIWRLRLVRKAWTVIGQHPDWNNTQVDAELERLYGRWPR